MCKAEMAMLWDNLVRVDRCAHGVWLDSGEFDLLLAGKTVPKLIGQPASSSTIAMVVFLFSH
jgi:Zn-finger nucleic acid-binding protein